MVFRLLRFRDIGRPKRVLRNALQNASSAAIRKRIGMQLRAVWNAPDLEAANDALRRLIGHYRDTAPKLAAWLENNILQGIAVFTLPERLRRVIDRRGSTITATRRPASAAVRNPATCGLFPMSSPKTGS